MQDKLDKWESDNMRWVARAWFRMALIDLLIGVGFAAILAAMILLGAD